MRQVWRCRPNICDAQLEPKRLKPDMVDPIEQWLVKHMHL
jgi:hypothetical protein